MVRTYVLFGLTLVSLSLAFYYSDRSSPATIEEKERKLFPDLVKELDAVNTVSIHRATGQVLQAARVEGQWMTPLLSDTRLFPVDASMLQGLLNDLASAHIDALKTQNAANYKMLGLDDVSGVGSDSSLVTLKTPTSTRALLIGHTSKHRNASFVRIQSEQQSILIDKVIQLPDTLEQWLLRPILPLQETNIKAIDIDGQEIDRQTFDFMASLTTALTEIDYLSVLERQSALLSWFTQNPVRVITLTTDDDVLRLSLFKNNESEQVWFIVDSEAELWQQHWAFELSPQTANSLMMPIE
jgi:hypothetical protein